MISTVKINGADVKIPSYTPTGGKKYETDDFNIDMKNPLEIASVLRHVLDNFDAYMASLEGDGSNLAMPTYDFMEDAMAFEELSGLVAEYAERLE